MLKRVIIVLILVATMSPAHAQKSSVKPKKSESKIILPGELAKIETRYAQFQTLEATFTQKKEIKSLQMTRESSGTLWLKRPDKLYWDTRLPEPSLLVSDGKTFWLYTPPFSEGQKGQVTITKANQFLSSLASNLLSGKFSSLKDIKIQKLSATRFSLAPKVGSAGDIDKIQIEIDPKESLVKKIALSHLGGNLTEIELQSIKLDGEKPDEFFQFQAPSDTIITHQ